MLAQNVASRGIGLVSQLALAALLQPADFGIVGLTYTVTSVATALTNVGIDDVVLQRRNALRLWAGSTFWISFGLALVAGVLVLAVSPLAASMYHTPQLIGMLAILALSMPLGALSSASNMMLRAHMRFGVLAIYGTLEIVALAVLTVLLAWAGFGAYSFVIPTPVMAAVRAVVFWRLAGPGMSFQPQRKRWKYVIGNTAVLFVTKTVVAVINQGGYVVLGLLATQEVVGVYYFGFRLAAQPLWILAGNFSNVLFPVLVHLKSNVARQADAALRASTLLSFCVMPLALLQAAVAGPLVISLFGQKWVESIPIIQLLSVGLALDAVSWVAGSLLNARGEFGAVLRYVMVQAPIFAVLVVGGALLGQAVGVAWAVCVFYAITQPVFVAGAYRRIGITRRQVAVIYLHPMALAAVAIGAGVLVSMLPALERYPLVRVVVIGMVGTGLYAALTRWFARQVWNELRDRMLGALRRRVVA